MTAADASQKRPVISAIMPAHNAAPFLEAAVRSIQEQSFGDWELIFVDDGSDDETIVIIDALAAKDERIKITALPHGGRGKARKACIERVSGAYVAICDSDDISMPDRFEKQLRFLESHPQIGVAAAWTIPFVSLSPDPCGDVQRWPTQPEEIAETFSRRRMRICNAAAMIRADLFRIHGSYNTELRRVQDYEFFARIHRNGVAFAALPEPLIFYRMASAIPSLAYFTENGMYKAYADLMLDGRAVGFETFNASLSGRAWRSYLAVKYIYFVGKSAAELLRHALPKHL